MGRLRIWVLLCAIVLLAAALPQCLSQEQGRRLLFETTALKRENRVNLRKGFRPRRSSTVPDRFSETADGDTIKVDMPHVFKKTAVVREDRLFTVRARRRLQSEEEQSLVVANVWPKQFIIGFKTQGGADSGFFAYDWVNRRQAVYYDPKSAFCQKQGTADACRMLEVPDGTYIYNSVENKCVAGAGLGSRSPSWTSEASFVGDELIEGVGVCKTFALANSSLVYGETADKGLPCLLSTPDLSSPYIFDPRTLKLSAPDEDLFDVPGTCYTLSGSTSSM